MFLFCCIGDGLPWRFCSQSTGFFKPSQSQKPRRRRHSADLEVITGNTAAILRSGITPVRALSDLTQQSSQALGRLRGAATA